jgi:hypothetical protein
MANMPLTRAQHGIAVDRFAREIVRILRASAGALAATECQSVGRQRISTLSVQLPRKGVLQ